MPPLKTNSGKIFMGIDPGLTGGVAWISGASVKAVPMPATEKDRWDLFVTLVEPNDPSEIHTVIEQIDPRPTKWFDGKKWQGSILKSTCLIYGNYMALRGMLIAAGISFMECPPKKWQKELGLIGKKGESKTAWKNRLKSKAQQIYPSLKVTLATADALLIATYCKQTTTN